MFPKYVNAYTRKCNRVLIITWIISSFIPYTLDAMCCSCTATDNTKGCPSDTECSDYICTYDDFCCKSKWDSLCAGDAAVICNQTTTTTTSSTTTTTTTPQPTTTTTTTTTTSTTSTTTTTSTTSTTTQSPTTTTALSDMITTTLSTIGTTLSDIITTKASTTESITTSAGMETTIIHYPTVETEDAGIYIINANDPETGFDTNILIVIGGSFISVVCVSGICMLYWKTREHTNESNHIDECVSSSVCSAGEMVHPRNSTYNAGLVQWFVFTIKLPQYMEVFIAQGYDDLLMIEIIESKEQLIEIGVKDKKHQKVIMNEINKLREEHKQVAPGVPQAPQAQQNDEGGEGNINDEPQTMDSNIEALYGDAIGNGAKGNNVTPGRENNEDGMNGVFCPSLPVSKEASGVIGVEQELVDCVNAHDQMNIVVAVVAVVAVDDDDDDDEEYEYYYEEQEEYEQERDKEQEIVENEQEEEEEPEPNMHKMISEIPHKLEDEDIVSIYKVL